MKPKMIAGARLNRLALPLDSIDLAQHGSGRFQFGSHFEQLSGAGIEHLHVLEQAMHTSA
jgi:hypothetical protein